MPSPTVENYVKTIFRLCQAGSERATTGRVAEAMHVSPGTVTSMLKTLSENGLIAYSPYEGAQLTESGNALAARIVRRHRLLEMFLAKVLDLSGDEVQQDAAALEHGVSDALLERIDQLLGHPDLGLSPVEASSQPNGSPGGSTNDEKSNAE